LDKKQRKGSVHRITPFMGSHPHISTVQRSRSEVVEILKCVVTVGALVGLVKCIQSFSRHCRRRFGHRFFTLRASWLAALAINLMWLGFYFYASSIRDHASINDGLVLVALSFVPIVWMVYENIRETNLVHGLGGSALQLALFFPVALYSLPLILIAMAIVLFASFKAGPAWLVDR
jgi:hypothetical protein